MSRALNLATVVGANDKLLKALITLLALRDRELLEELNTVFHLAGANGDEADAALSHIGRELEVIADLVADDEEEDSAAAAPRSQRYS